MSRNILKLMKPNHEFGVRALYDFCECVLTRLNDHDRAIINELMVILSETSQDLDSIIRSNKSMFASVYHILFPQVELSATMTNYAGIVLGKIEDILFHDDADEDDEIST